MQGRRTIDITRALRHPARRRMLRRLNAERRPCSLVELAREAGLPQREFGYHLRVLEACKVTEPVKQKAAPDSAAPRHQTDVADDRWVRAQLAATKVEDEAGPFGRSPVVVKASTWSANRFFICDQLRLDPSRRDPLEAPSGLVKLNVKPSDDPQQGAEPRVDGTALQLADAVELDADPLGQTLLGQPAPRRSSSTARPRAAWSVERGLALRRGGMRQSSLPVEGIQQIQQSQGARRQVEIKGMK